MASFFEEREKAFKNTRSYYGFKTDNAVTKPVEVSRGKSNDTDSFESIRAQYGFGTSANKSQTISNVKRTQNNTNSLGTSFEGRSKPSAPKQPENAFIGPVVYSTADYQQMYDDKVQELANFYAKSQIANKNKEVPTYSAGLGQYGAEIKEANEVRDFLFDKLTESKARDEYYNNPYRKLSTDELQAALDEKNKEISSLMSNIPQQYKGKNGVSFNSSLDENGEAFKKANEEKKSIEKYLNLSKRNDYYNESVSKVSSTDPETDKLLKQYVQLKYDSQVLGNTSEGMILANLNARLSSDIMKRTGWSEKEFEEISDSYEYVFNADNAEKQQEWLYEYSKKHQGVGTAIRTASNVLGGLSTVDMLIQQLENRGTDKPIDTNTYLSHWSRDAETAEQAVLSTIKSDIGKTAYSTAMSMVDSMINAGISAGIGGLFEAPKVAQTVRTLTTDFIMGSSVASREYRNNIEKGYSDGEALASAVLKGAVEGFTEAVSIETILDSVKSGKTAWNVLIKPFLSEGTEELSANWLGRAVDSLFDGGEELRSAFENAYNTAVDNGKNKTDAFFTALWDTVVKEDVETFILGGLSGAVMGGTFYSPNVIAKGVDIASRSVSNAIENAQQRKYDIEDIKRNYGNYQNNEQSKADLYSLVQEGLETDKTSRAYKRSSAVSNDLQNGNNVSVRRIYDMQRDIINEYARARNNTENNTQNTRALTPTEASESGLNVPNEINRNVSAAPTQSATANIDNTAVAEVNRRLRPAEAQIMGTDGKVQNVTAHLFSDTKKREVYLSNGEKRNVKDIVFNNDNERDAYFAAIDYDTETANAMIQGFSNTPKYVQAFEHFYRSGASGVTYDYGENALSNQINEIVARQAFALGRQNAMKQNGKGGTYFTRDYSSKVKLKANQKRQLAVIESYANKHKIRVSVVASYDGGKSNGVYDTKTNTIVIALDAKEGAYVAFASHELAHRLKVTNIEAYTEVRNRIETYLKNKKGYDLEGRIKEIQALYKRRLNQELSREEALEEIVGNSLIPALSDRTFVENLAEENKGLLKKIREWIDEFVKELERITNELAKSYSEVGAVKEDIALMKDIRDIIDESLSNGAKAIETDVAKADAYKDVSGRFKYSLDDVDPVEPTNNSWKRTITFAELKAIHPDLYDVTADEQEARNPTQIKTTVNTYRKIYNILKGDNFKGTILDASSGLGYGTRAGIEEYGFEVDDIEPYPDKNYQPKYTDYSKLNKKYDVIISNAVLNVVPQDTRDALVVKMGSLLKEGGRMFINVRGKDVDTLANSKNNDKLGNMEWYVASTGSYQKGFTKSELKAYLEDALGDKFVVKPTNEFGGVSVIVEKKKSDALEHFFDFEHNRSRASGEPKVKYWTPKFTQTEWDALDFALRTQANKNINIVDEESNWLYTNYKGTKIFAIYDIDESNVKDSTILFAVSGQKAVTGRNFMEAILDGVNTNSKSFGRWFELLPDVCKRKIQRLYDVRNGGTDNGYDSVLSGELSQSNDGRDSKRSSKISKNKHSLNEPDLAEIEAEVESKTEEMKKIRKVADSSFESLLTIKGLNPTVKQQERLEVFLKTERYLAMYDKTIAELTAKRDKELDGKKAAEISESLNKNYKKRAETEQLYNQRLAEPEIQELIKKSVNMQLKQLIEEYGSIKPGFNPVREIEVPKRTSPNKKVRQTVRTILESGAITDDMIPDISQEVLNETFSYVPVSDDEARNYAEHYLNKYGYEAGMQAWESALRGDKRITKNDIAIAEYLLQQAANDGNIKDVLKLSAELSAEGTRAGQTAQAISLLKKLGTPEIQHLGQLYYIQKAVDNLNKDIEKQFAKKITKGKVSTIKIDEALAEDLLSAETEAEYNLTVDKIIKNVADQMPSTWADKWNAWRYLAMLGNVRTHTRNIIGNALFVPAIEFKNFVGALVEKGAIKNSNRTKSIIVDKAYRDFANDDFTKVKDYITSGSRYDELGTSGNITARIKQNQKIFNPKWLETARKTNSRWLENEDIWFLSYHYKRALSQYLQANHAAINGLTEGSVMLEKARAYAIAEAQKATYRDFSAVTQAINHFAKSHSAARFALNSILPFRSTPINILKRGIEYSPMGLAKALSYGTYQLTQRKITANQYIDGISAGFTGTIAMAIGAILYLVGFVQPGYDDEEEQKFDELQGGQEYSLKFGDVTYTFDWAAPMSLPFFLGAQFAQVARDKKGLEVKEIFDVLSMVTEPMLELSMLKGLNSTIESVGYDGQNKAVPIITSMFSSYLKQAVPTLLGQAARILDNKARSTYIDKNSAFPDEVQRFSQQVIAKVPFIATKKNPYINAWGEEKEESILFRILENTISPGYFEIYNTNDVEKELEGLYKATNEKSVLPKTAQKYFNVNNEQKDLTAKEYVTFATVRGQTAYETLTDVFNLSEYDGLEDKEKVYVVGKAYDYATTIAKMSVSDYKPTDSSDTMWIARANEAYEKYGISIEQSILYELYKNNAEDNKEEQLKAIDKLELTRSQKNGLYKLHPKKYSEKTIDEAPWN